MERESHEQSKENYLSRRKFVESVALVLGSVVTGGNLAHAAEALSRFALLEAREKGPEISFDIFFSEHFRKEDAAGLAEKLATVDIYIPEIAGWDEKLGKRLNDVSWGRMTPEELWAYGDYMSNAFQDAEVRALFGKKVLVHCIDISLSDSPIETLTEVLEDLYSFDYADTFETALKKKKAAIKRFADVQKERERHMAENLVILIDRISHRQIPELSARNQVRILFHLGSVHTYIYHRVREEDPKTKKYFKTNPHIYNYEQEAVRRYIFGKEVSDDLVAKVMLEHIFSQTGKLSYATQKGNAANERATIGKLSIEQIKELYEEKRGKFHPEDEFL